MRIFSGQALQFSGSGGYSTLAQMSGTTFVASSPIPIPHLQGYSVQASYLTSGSAGVTGSFKLQASNDPTSTAWNDKTNPVVLTNWTDISGSSVAVQASGSGNNAMWNVDGAYYSWFRLAYTNTSGSGSLTATATGKGPNG
jgi:hypothetical protein